ncbi:MAG: hypothetical protein V3V08_23285 [Nannocystaceae bacterium]
MANINSKTITDLIAAKPHIAQAGKVGGNVRVKVENWVEGTVASGANGPVAEDDVMRMFRVNSGDIPIMVLMHRDDMGATVNVDIGLYDINGGAEVQKDIYADGKDVATPVTINNLVFVGTNADPTAVANHEGAGYMARNWQHLGLTADSQKDYDLCVTWNLAPSVSDFYFSLIYLYVDEG